MKLVARDDTVPKHAESILEGYNLRDYIDYVIQLILIVKV